MYEDKAGYVEKNRRRLIREADKATTEARTRYEEAIAAAEKARSDLVECRTAALWAALYAGEHATQSLDVAAIAANLQKPVESVLRIKNRLSAEGVFRVLRSDAEILATAMTNDQARELGVADPSQDAAIWHGTPEDAAALKKEREEARERFRREWGREPGW